MLPPDPVALATTGPRPRIVACCPRAAVLGVAPGITASAARALAARLKIHARDERAEADALAGIATWAQQFTPAVSLAPPFTVLLETGGSARLFGGAERLSRKIHAGLVALGFKAVIASAPTPLAAELLARAGQGQAITDAGRLAPALMPLPLALLGLAPEAIQSLEGLGIRTLGDCRSLPRDALARRFGQALPDTLDRAFGHLPDPRPLYAAPPVFSARLELPLPAQEAEALLFGAKRMLLELAGFLRARRQGVTRLRVTLHHEKHPPTDRVLRLSVPNRSPSHLLALLRERLHGLELQQPATAMVLLGEETAPLAPRNARLFGDEAPAGEALELTLSRLRARLGEHAVTALVPFADHRPERAHGEGDAGADGAPLPVGPRPLWLLPEPQPLRVRRGIPWMDTPLTLIAGPERIESGWWDGCDVTRDYFVACRDHGETFWIFREPADQGGWFVHGIFA